MAIIGNGDIASVLEGMNPNFVFFASGVSNSQETDEMEYRREKALLLAQDETRHIVYFSSLGVFTRSDERYFSHKLEMETFIKSIYNKYTIVRLGNILWGNNPHTFFNAYRLAQKESRPYEIRDEWRYVIDKNEFLYWVSLIPDWSCEINIPGQRMKVIDILNKYGHA